MRHKLEKLLLGLSVQVIKSIIKLYGKVPLPLKVPLCKLCEYVYGKIIRKTMKYAINLGKA